MTPNILPRGPLTLAFNRLQSAAYRGRNMRAPGTLTRKTTRGTLTRANSTATTTNTTTLQARWA